MRSNRGGIVSCDVLARIPEAFWHVRYVGSRFPGSATTELCPKLASGANCQLYAYEVARHFGLDPLDLRSSELWEDTEATERVSDPQPLDLILFNATADPWGAHVGLWVGDDQVLHLCAEIGYPAPGAR